MVSEEPTASHRPVPVLYVHLGENWIRGSERVLLDLIGGLDRARFVPIVWCNSEAPEQACRALGVPTHRSRMSYFFADGAGTFRPGRYIDYIRTCYRLIRTHRVGLIHANSAAVLQFVIPAAIFANVPVLAHLHNDYPRRSRYAFLAHLADLLVGVSELIVAPFAADGVAVERRRVIFNGIDPTRFGPLPADPRTEFGLSPDEFVIATVGSLIRRKGHDVLLRAMAGLEAQGRPARLLIAGEGSERAALEALARDLGITGSVRFLGEFSNPGPLYAAADVFVLASRSEALPLALLEAAHFALPAVASQVGGIPEIVRDGETGMLVPPDDPAALSDALSRLMADAALRRTIGAAAQAQARAHFTVLAMLTSFEKAYADLLKRQILRAKWRDLPSKFRPYLRLLATATKSRHAHDPR